MNDIGKTKYSPTNSNWLYTYIDIPNLEIIQKELIRLLSLPIPKVKYNRYYTNIYVPNIVRCPTLMAYLDSIGIKSKLLRVIYSDGSDINDAAPHVDSSVPDTEFRFSLNIPLIDAEDSYTVWYKQLEEEEILYDVVTKTGWSANKDNIIEIDRMRYTGPALINNTVLHSGKITSNRRLIVGIRFKPELTLEELQRIGVPIPLNQS